MSTALQEITVDYKAQNSTEILNRFNYPAMQTGVFSGGLMTTPSANTARVADFTAYIKSTTNDVLVKVKTTGNQDVTISEAKPYVVMSFTWVNQQNNIATFSNKSLGEVIVTDVVLGMAVYTLGVITGFDYLNKTWGRQLSSDVPIGVPPFILTSTTKVDNLNADMIDDKHFQDIVNALYPVGSFYVQYPDAASNDDATAFPTSKRPATLYGGTWVEQFNTENVFFRTAGTDGQTRSNGLSLDQMQRLQGNLPEIISNTPTYTFNGVFTMSGQVNERATSGATGDGAYNIEFDSADSPNARTSTLSSGFTEPRNRLMKLWKRTAL